MTASPRPDPSAAPRPGRWLLLIHHLPPEPAYLRVKVRRQLQRIGAVALKNSVYVLPNRPESLEDFHWLRREILDAGGQATITSADFIEGSGDLDLAGRFPEEPPRPGTGDGETVPVERAPTGAVWVTRRDVHVDRIASAWLIRRFIDPAARFKFVESTGYQPRRGELRFDMFEGEYTHEGDRCTFQVLVARFGLTRPALESIGEIVHDIDYRLESSERPETAAVALMIRGICRSHQEDEARLDAGRTLFDSLYSALDGEGE